MDGSSHIQILFLLISNDMSIWRLVTIASLIIIILFLFSWVLDISAHSHFLLEINLAELVALLSILNLPVPLVDEMIAGCYMVVTVILNTFLSIFSFEIVLLQ